MGHETGNMYGQMDNWMDKILTWCMGLISGSLLSVVQKISVSGRPLVINAIFSKLPRFGNDCSNVNVCHQFLQYFILSNSENSKHGSLDARAGESILKDLGFNPRLDP